MALILKPTPLFTNLMDDANSYTKEKSRWSLSGGGWTTFDYDSLVYRFKMTSGTHTLRIRGIEDDTVYSYMYYGTTNNSFITAMSNFSQTTNNYGDMVFNFSTGSGWDGYATMTVASGAGACSNIIVTMDQEIKYQEGDPDNWLEIVGYRTGWRVKSDGSIGQVNGMCCSGFIPVKKGDTIRVKNITLQGSNTGYLVTYNSSKALIVAHSINVLQDNGSGVYEYTITEDAAAFARISAGTIDQNTIVLVNKTFEEGPTGAEINIEMKSKNGITLLTSGKYCEKNIYVAPSVADQSALKAENIRRNVSILGVTGSLGSPYEAIVPKLCAYIATATVTATSATTYNFQLKSPYNNWVESAANNSMLAYTAGDHEYMGYQLGVSLATDTGQSTGSSFSRCMMVGSTSANPTLSVQNYNSTLGNLPVLLNTYNNKIMCFIVDKNLVTNNKAAYPQRKKFSDLFTIPSGVTVIGEEVFEDVFNWFFNSTTSDGSLYNGLGYKKGYRIRSGGAEEASSTAVCTGYIPFKQGDTLRIYPPFEGFNANNAINFSDGNFTNLGQSNDNGAVYGICDSTYICKTNGNVSTLTLDSTHNANIRYARVTHHNKNIDKIVITVNEPIEDTGGAVSETITPHIAVRSTWYNGLSNGKISLINSNTEAALGVTTANSFAYTDRNSNTFYLIPIDAKYNKATLNYSATDGLAVRYFLQVVKESGGTFTSVASVGKGTDNVITWTKGAANYLLASIEHTAGSNWPWDSAGKTISITFSG